MSAPETAEAPGIEELRSRVPGRVALPGEPDYEIATPWDRAVPVDPAAVVAVADATDVAEVVR